MTRRLADALVGLDVAVGPDPTDLRSLPAPDVPWRRSLDDLGAPLRVAWSPTLGYARRRRRGRRRSAQRAVDVLAGARHRGRRGPVRLRRGPGLVVVHRGRPACNERTLEPLRDTDAWEQVDPGLRETADLARAQFGPVDVVRALDDCHTPQPAARRAVPPALAAAVPDGRRARPARSASDGTIEGEGDVNWVRFTYPFNMTRSPAGTVCAGFTSDGMPVGLQIDRPAARRRRRAPRPGVARGRARPRHRAAGYR